MSDLINPGSIARERTPAQVQSMRKAVFRAIRKAERATDTELEILERRLFQLLKRKTLLQPFTIKEVAMRYNAVVRKMKVLERAIIDGMIVMMRE